MKQKGRPWPGAEAGTAVLAAVLLSLTGCSALEAVQAEPRVTGQGTAVPNTPQAGAPAPDAARLQGNQPGSLNPGSVGSGTVSDAAAATASAVHDALAALAGESGRPSTGQVVNALTLAGFSGTGIEVTPTLTPTGLEADAVESAVLQGTECIFGHIRDGEVTVTVLPVLASGRCFVGSAP